MEDTADRDEAKLAIAAISSALAIASFVIARRTSVRAKKAESIKQLLGEKEAAAFAALKLLQDGLPVDTHERQTVLLALMQACVFEGSDRTRALLYRVIDVNRAKYGQECKQALEVIQETFTEMDRFQFTKEQLDLDRGRRRIAVAERVVNGL